MAVCSHPEREKCDKMEDGLIERWNEKERYMNVKQQARAFVVVTSYLEKKPTQLMKESLSGSDCGMRKSFRAVSSHSVKKVNRNTFLKEMRIYLLALVVQL